MSSDNTLSSNDLSRRDMVILLTNMVAVSSGLTLLGCSSDSPAGSSGIMPGKTDTTLPQVNGTVSLPPGSTLSLSALTVAVMGQAIPLTAGSFAVGVSDSSPSLAMVTDAAGNGIMAGFLQHGSNATITPHSTATALVWFSLGGPFVPGNLKAQLLALLDADDAIATLGGVIASRIAADSHAIINGDSAVAAALSSALSTVTNGAITSPVQSAFTSSGLQTITITPPTDQSGLNLRQGTSTDPSVNISNYLQRPVKVYIYETQNVTAGVTTTISPARLVAGPLDLGVPVEFTPVGGLRTFLALNTPFKPYTIPPIPVPLDGSADVTTYEVVVVGPSANGVTPSFFSAPRYANEVAAWTKSIEDQFARIYYVDCVYAALLEINGFGSIVPNAPTLVAAGANTQKVLGTPFDDTPKIAKAVGLLAPKLNKLLGAAMNNPDLLGITQNNSSNVLDKLQAAALDKVNQVDWQASLKTGSDFFYKLGDPVGNYKPTGTLTKLFNTLAVADMGVMWTVVVGKSSVTISPTDPSGLPGDQVALTLNLSSDLLSTYEFVWSSSSPNATFSAVGEANNGATITTRKFAVNLVMSLVDLTNINVSAVVYDVANGGHVRVTDAGTTVRILPLANISPNNPFLTHGDQKTFSVTVNQALPTGVHYLWSLTGVGGSIGAGGLLATTVPTVLYTAIQPGVDTLTVQVLDINDRVFAKGVATVNVDQEVAQIAMVISGTWDPVQTPADGSYNYADGQGARQFGSPTLDALTFVYNQGTNSDGIILTFAVPTGSAVVTGQVFNKLPPATPISAGMFQLDLVQDQHNVDGSIEWAVGSSGTFTFTSVTQLADGTFVAHFTMNISNGIGGIITATGIGRWKVRT